MDSTIFNQIVEPSWLARPSPEVAPDLIGCTLVRQLDDGHTIRGMIVETEAYAPEDPAFHAYRRITQRNQVVFGPPGRAYVYLIYGLYHCFNIVTDQEGVPSAVLIRALQLSVPPTDNLTSTKNLMRQASGPGKLSRILEIDRSLNNCLLQLGQPLWLEHRNSQFQQQLDQQSISFVKTTRIGISQGIELPWRWYLSQCPAVSKL